MLNQSGYRWTLPKWLNSSIVKLQASLLQSFLPNSARFGYVGGTTQSSAHLSAETTPSPLRAIFLDLSFPSTAVCNSLSEFCVQHCFKFFMNWSLEIRWFSHTAQVSWWSAVVLRELLPGEPSVAETSGASTPSVKSFRHDSGNLILSVVA